MSSLQHSYSPCWDKVISWLFYLHDRDSSTPILNPVLPSSAATWHLHSCRASSLKEFWPVTTLYHWMPFPRLPYRYPITLLKSLLFTWRFSVNKTLSTSNQSSNESTLAQVMACCLTAQSHYLNQCRLIISKFLWHPSEGITLRKSEARLKITFLKSHPGANELKNMVP